LGRIERGVILEEGEIVGSISGTEGKRFKILPHVHISVAWIPEDSTAENLDWKIMNTSPDIPC
jgi:cell wall assembly regulator SMI1